MRPGLISNTSSPAIRAGEIPVDRLVTHRTTLRDSPRDIALWSHQKSGLIKAMIDVRGGLTTQRQSGIYNGRKT